MPKISVITPFFNRAETLEKAINSVLSQSFKDFEYILVNDGSSDNSIQVVRSFSDPRIRLLGHEKNKGVAYSRNVGIKASSSEFISFLDSDDELMSDFLERSTLKLEKSSEKVGFVWTGKYYVNSSKVSVAPGWIPERNANSLFDSFLRQLQVGIGGGVTIKRFVFNEVGLFDERMEAAEDTDFFLRAAKKFDAEIINEPLIKINKTSNSRLSSSYKKLAHAYSIIISKHEGEILKDAYLAKKYFYKFMWLNYYAGNKAKARQSFRWLKKNNLLTPKSRIINILFEIFPLKLAKRIHNYASIRKQN